MPWNDDYNWESMRSSEEILEDERYHAHQEGDCIYMDHCDYCEAEKARNEAALMAQFDAAIEELKK